MKDKELEKNVPLELDDDMLDNISGGTEDEDSCRLFCRNCGNRFGQKEHIQRCCPECGSDNLGLMRA